MRYYRIAGLTVQMSPTGRTQRQAEPYRIAPVETPQIRIPEQLSLPGGQALSPDEQYYLASGACFYRQLLNFDGLFLHASAVVLDEKAYLFSAPSGTGKSTHAQLWLQEFGPERAQILNDDKPAIRMEDGRFYAWGTPWSGKEDLSMNRRFPLAGICLLERGEENTVTRCDSVRALFALTQQTYRPTSQEEMHLLMTLMDRLLRQVPVYRLQCNIQPEAARVAYRAMHRES